jgi:hypothetical protein
MTSSEPPCSAQSSLKSWTIKSDTAVLASYMLSEILVNKMKPFSDGEIIKECLEAVAFSDRKHTISNVSVSRFAIGRRIE